MPSMKDIKRRIRSVGSIEQITRAMKMVAAAKLRRVQGRMLAMRPYTNHIAAILGRLAPEIPEADHPLLHAREVRRIGVLFFAGERGLCGAFNSNLAKALDAFLARHADTPVQLAVVGRKAIEHARRRGLDTFAAYEDICDHATFTTASSVAQRLAQGFRNEDFDALYFLHAQFINTMTHETVRPRILPFDIERLPQQALEGAPPVYLTEPSPQAVFDKLVQEYITYQTYQALLESAGSEHSARMTAMDSATQNAEEVIDTLTLDFNRARQSSITFEILDIVSGAEALKTS